MSRLEQGRDNLLQLWGGSSGTRHAASFASGVGVYAVLLRAGTWVQMAMRVSAAQKAIGTMLGALSVGTAGIVSSYTYIAVLTGYVPSVTYLTASPESAFYLGGALLGFKLLRGRFRYLSPADLHMPGVFSGGIRGSLPSWKGTHYADDVQRRLLASFGNTYGCHHCGLRGPAEQFIADHMPPNKFAKQTLWKTTQRYYPQCSSCSKLQSASVRRDKRTLVRYCIHV